MGSVRKSFDEPARFCYDKNANKYGQGDGRMSADFSLAKAYEKYFKIGAAVTPYQLQIHGDLSMRTQLALSCTYGACRAGMRDRNFASAFAKTS